MIFKNTHPTLIDQGMIDRVRIIRQSKCQHINMALLDCFSDCCSM